MLHAYIQICYFTLAWGIGARLPARTYILLTVAVGAMAVFAK